MPNYVQGPPFPRGLYSGDRGYSFGALVAVAIAASPGGLTRNSNGTVSATTSAAHRFLVGEIVTLIGTTSVGGTRFDGNYILQAAPSGTTMTLLPVDDVVLHQAVDTGGAGTANGIQSEQPAVPQSGKAFGLVRDGASDFTPNFYYAEGIFDAAPGVFEVDIQVADVDVDTAYVTSSGMNITTVNANNAFRAAVQDQANFVRMRMVSRTNNVNFWGWVRG